ncbi:transglycosylase SLT domain-containing protein [Streptomyces sp. NRRL F-5630]|uniref:transglycosylase SLT domain-containing protein n=1 Tax=Streptomyces sp. NRRL F-5630 TaxID=1463864 RepID=UPI0004C826D2|nr:transglycosylase SLT domain-containing protein [Streptomyces sp. NRRL F-5630]
MPDHDIVGTVGVDVVPLLVNFHRRLQEQILPAAERAGQAAGDRIADAIGRQVSSALPDAIRESGRRAQAQATRSGDQTGGAFASSLRRRLRAAMAALPDIDVGMDASGVDAELARIRAELARLSDQRIGIGIDTVSARADVAHLEERLRALGEQHPNPRVRVDTATARAALAELRADIDAATRSVDLEVHVPGGELATRLRSAVQAAQAALPDVRVDADTSPAARELAALRGDLAALGEANIGVDLDAGAAMERISAIEVRLRWLSAHDADIQVRVDAAAALARLATVGAAVEALNRREVNIKVDTSQAVSALLVLSAALGGVAVIPALPAIAAGLGAVAAAATAAAAGLGGMALVAVPAIKKVSEVFQAQAAASDEAAKSTDNGAKATTQAAQRALQMASAQDSLAQAHRQAARSIAQANRQVESATRAVEDAQQRAADQRTQSARAIERAEQSIVDAQRGVVRAEQSLTDSHRSVTRAERDLSDAQKSARQAQDDLTAARKTAARQLADLDDQLRDGQLDQRDATLRLQEAQADLTKAMNDPRSTQLQRDRAQLAFEQAQQHLKEQKQSYKDLQTAADEQRKAGVEGSKVVLDAQARLTQAQRAQVDAVQAVADAQRSEAEAAQGVADAQRQVREQTQALADAQKQAARDQVDAAQRVKDAQRGVADAVQAVADAQADGSRQVEAAERGVQSARLSGIDTTVKAATAQDKYREALAGLTPAQRALYDSVVRLKAEFKEWSESLQPGVLALFTRGVNAAGRTLPAFTPLVEGATRAVSRLFDAASRNLKTPFWRDFKKDIQTSAEPAVYGFGVAFGNVITGIAGVIDAFFPHMDGISRRLEDATKSFADWGKGLKGSPEFERFLNYASTNGPIVWQTLKDIGGAFLDVGKALSPLSGPLLQIIGGFAKVIGVIATDAPFAVQAIWLVIVATKAWTLAQWLLNAALRANPIGLIVTALGVLVTAMVVAYKRFPAFRKVVDTCWSGIKTAFSLGWKLVKPIFDLWVLELKLVGKVFGWLYNTIIKPIADRIGKRWKGLYEKDIKPFSDAAKKVLTSLGKTGFKWLADLAILNLKAMGTAIKFLADKVVRPGFSVMRTVIKGTWNDGVKPIFSAMRKGVKAISDSFDTAQKAIGKAWGKLKEITRKPVAFIVNTVYNNGIRAVWRKVVDAFGGKPLKKVEGFARGGFVLPGTSSFRDGDDQLVPMRKGEGVYVSEAMRDPYERARLYAVNKAAMRGQSLAQYQGGGGGFALGGIFDGLGDVASDAWDKAKKGAKWLKDSFGGAVSSGVKKIINPLINRIPGESRFTDALKDTTRALVDKLLGAGKKADKEGIAHVNYRADAGVEQWRPVVLQALRAVHQPTSLAGSTLRRMNQESGGNPTVVNKWDSNWQAGHPSVGLMQVIGPTFESYAGKYRSKGPKIYGVSVDPMANIYASMRYALGSYGSLSKAYDRPGGYAKGGFPPVGENVWVGENGPELVRFLAPAQVHDASTSRAMVRGVQAGGGAPNITVESHTYVGNREITDIVDHKIKVYDANSARLLDNGRY